MGTLRYIPTLLFACLIVFPVYSQQPYTVLRGERPPVNLDDIPENAFEKGRIRIKLLDTWTDHLDAVSVGLDENGIVQFQIPELDRLNDLYRITGVESLFSCNGFRDEFKERHRAWGFHLWFTLYFDERANVREIVKAYGELEDVTVAEPEYIKTRIDSLRISHFTSGQEQVLSAPDWTPNDPQYGQQWHYHNTGQQSGTPDADIDLPEAWDLETGNSNVIVAIEDGGIQYDHPDIAANMWSGIGYDFVNNDASIEPDDHGTHVAGTVAAVNNNGTGVSGVAGGSGGGNGIRLMSCQVFTATGGGGFHLAPIYAADEGAAISQNSWGYTNPGVYEQAVLDAIDYFNTNGGGGALLNGGITIYAAGNSNSQSAYYPGYYSGTFSVAATTNTDTKSYYSNYGSWVDISAPGGETISVLQRGILSTVTGNGYDFYQGTSMACPHTSGVAALIASLGYGSVSASDVADILQQTADDHYGVNPTYTGLLGTGRLNAYQALLETQNYLNGLVNPSSFTATPISTSEIELTWIKNNSNHDVLVVGSLNETMGSPENGSSYTPGQLLTGGGAVLYSGSNTSFNHTNLDPGTKYHYKAYSYNELLEYSNGKATSAKTLCAPVTSLPWTEDFEDAEPAIYTSDVADITGLCFWSYDQSAAGGRLRFAAGPGFYHGGSRAATLDRDPSGSIITNYLTTELDLSDYTLSDDLELSFYFMHHDEENNANDRVWVRGSNADIWVEIYNLNDNQGVAGSWVHAEGLDIDAVLATAIPPQTVSSTFQIRFGQQDNFPATSTTVSDGMTFDDISITGSRLFSWTGIDSDDWDFPGNWSPAAVPTANDAVEIPAIAPYWPVKTGDLILGTSCSQVELSGAANLVVTGNVVVPFDHSLIHSGSGTITAAGNWEIYGTFSPGSGTVLLNSSSPAVISATDEIEDFLLTTFAGGNGAYGNMFDVVAKKNITIDHFDCNLDSGTGMVYIYYKAGTYVGYETNASAWNLAGSASVTSTGVATPTPVPVAINVTIPAGLTYAFYVHAVNGNEYSNGTTVGAVFTENDDIQVLQGCGKDNPLFTGQTFQPRVFNGNVHYRYHTDNDIDFNHLNVDNAGVEIENTANLNLSGSFTVKPGSWFNNTSSNTINISGDLLLEADENGMASYLDEGTTAVGGISRVQQHLAYTPPFQWHAVSPPITDATINTYLDLYLYAYDEPVNEFVNLALPTTLPMNIGQGYYVTGSDQYLGTTTVTFETSTPGGHLNQNDVVLDGFTVSGPDPAYEGFRLAGNPYPCALVWNENWAMSNLSGWMVVMDNGIPRGVHADGTAWQGGSPVIPSTQGFWIRALSADAGLTIPASERLHHNQGFYKSSLAGSYPLIRLEAHSPLNSDETVVIFRPEGTPGFDGYYDLTKFSNPEDHPHLATVYDGISYAFNALPQDYSEQVIPLEFRMDQAGTYEILATEIANLVDGDPVYLEDILENTLVDLTMDPTYTFQHTPGADPHRFNLRFNESVARTGENRSSDIQIFSNGNTLTIYNPENLKGTIRMFDLPGQHVASFHLEPEPVVHFSITLKPGYYIVHLVTDRAVPARKVLIR